MAVDWMTQAAREINDGADTCEDTIREVIVRHCPMKDGVAYMPVPRCGLCVYWKLEHDVHGTCQKLHQLTSAAFGCVECRERK